MLLTKLSSRESHRSTPSSKPSNWTPVARQQPAPPQFAHRTERNNSGSEGWGFESLRARKQAGPWRAEGLATAQDVPRRPSEAVSLGGLRQVLLDGIVRDVSDAIYHDVADLSLADQPEELLRRHAKTPSGFRCSKELSGHLHLQMGDRNLVYG